MIIGVTGGIGAGKSSVSSILRELGAVVLDADQISREVTEPGRKAWQEIIKAFGIDVLMPDQRLDRKKLAGIVFHSEQKLLLLEDIIHREVTAIIRREIDTLLKQGFRGVIVLDAPIPAKKGFQDTVDQIWVVTCHEEERIRRVMARSSYTYEEAKSRIEAQMPQEEYKRLAHIIIENNGTIEALRARVEDLYKAIGPEGQDSST
jgi:dephospho-CoA kinase